MTLSLHLLLQSCSCNLLPCPGLYSQRTGNDRTKIKTEGQNGNRNRIALMFFFLFYPIYYSDIFITTHTGVDLIFPSNSLLIACIVSSISWKAVICKASRQILTGQIKQLFITQQNAVCLLSLRTPHANNSLAELTLS